MNVQCFLGPLSDTNTFQRVILAYQDNKLIPKDESKHLAKICIYCAKDEHKARYCPSRYRHPIENKDSN
jgi:hypothetical protein